MKVNVLRFLSGILVVVLVLMGFGILHVLRRVDNLDAKQSESVRTLDLRVQELQAPPTPEEVAARIIATNEGKLVAAIARMLSEEPSFSAALRGDPGKDADPNEIAELVLADLLSRSFTDTVALELWAKRQAEIVSQPQLIATVAAEVYETYGEELRMGIAGGITAEKIAKLLSDSHGFAELVAFMSVQSSKK